MKLEGPKAEKEVLVLCELKVSTAFEKSPFNFDQKATRVSNCNRSERTRVLAVRFERRFEQLETGQQSVIFSSVFRLQYFKSGQFERYSGRKKKLLFRKSYLTFRIVWWSNEPEPNADRILNEKFKPVLRQEIFTCLKAKGCAKILTRSRNRGHLDF